MRLKKSLQRDFSFKKELRHMRTSFAFGLALVLAASLISVRHGSRPGYTLAGKMAAFSYLLGGPWNCSTNVPAMGSRPAHTDQGTANFRRGAG